MNFQIAKGGHSFKGAFAYYLHDKQESGPRLDTADRVAWTECLNLAHDDPAYAQSVMIATARNAEALKAAAGVAKTGRKATAGPVHAYSIAWHPDGETVPDRAGMIAIAKETLKLQKADHLQAVIVAHQDTAHPHVHIVVNRVNRVDPATGKMHVFGNNAYQLTEWAAKYERDRNQIVSPNRAKKDADRRKWQQARAQQRKPEAPTAQLAFAKHAPPAVPSRSPREKSPAAELAEKQAVQKDRHKQEWLDLSAAHKVRRSAIYAQRVNFKDIAARHRAETKPLWSELGKEQAAERRTFFEREKRLSGIVRNAIDIVRGQQIRGVADDRGFLVMCFNYTLSAQARRAAFAMRQREAKDELARRVDAGLIVKFEAGKAERTAKLIEAGQIYQAARAVLIERQNGETAKIRLAWRQHYAERDDGRRPAWRRSAASPARVPGSRSAQPEPSTGKREFEKAGKLPVANQSPEELRALHWAQLAEQGQRAREQARGMVRQRTRTMQRER